MKDEWKIIQTKKLVVVRVLVHLAFAPRPLSHDARVCPNPGGQALGQY